MTHFDSYYLAALDDVLHDGAPQRNERTGQDVIAYAGLHMRLELSKGFPALTVRRIPLKLFTAEMIWFLSGERDLTWLQRYTRVWDAFVETDGRLAAPYGYRWRRQFGRDQLREGLRQLERDPSTRQVVISTWHPGRDGLTNQGAWKNVPCLPTWTANIIDERLNLAVDVRSNDMMLGCPHDVAGYALLAYLLAAHLGVTLGVLSYRVAHAHIYAQHIPGARELLGRVTHQHQEMHLELPRPALGWAMGAQEADMDCAVRTVLEGLEPHYYPAPSIKGLKLFL